MCDLLEIDLIDDLNKVEKEENLNILPCVIDLNGTVENIESYFLVKQPEEGKYRASFRGRALKGIKIDLPTKYRGLIIETQTPQSTNKEKEKKRKRDSSDEEKIEEAKIRKASILNSFDSFFYWQHDDEPSTESLPFQWFEWPHISRVLHSPVSSQQIEQIVLKNLSVDQPAELSNIAEEEEEDSESPKKNKEKKKIVSKKQKKK